MDDRIITSTAIRDIHTALAEAKLLLTTEEQKTVDDLLTRPYDDKFPYEATDEMPPAELLGTIARWGMEGDDPEEQVIHVWEEVALLHERAGNDEEEEHAHQKAAYWFHLSEYQCDRADCPEWVE